MKKNNHQNFNMNAKSVIMQVLQSKRKTVQKTLAFTMILMLLLTGAFSSANAHMVNTQNSGHDIAGYIENVPVYGIAEMHTQALDNTVLTEHDTENTMNTELDTVNNTMNTEYDANAAETSISFRMKPIKDQYSKITASDVTEEIAKYSDLTTHWSKNEVAKLSKLGIVQGVGQGTFYPAKNVTVAEYTKMTIRVLGYKVDESQHKPWYKGYVDIALEEGLYKSGDFNDYNRVITREEAAKVAFNALMLYEEQPTRDMDQVVIKRAKDYNLVDDSLKQTVLSTNVKGLMSINPAGNFLPKNQLTRAEAATIMIRLIDAKTRLPFNPEGDECIVWTDKDGSVRYVTSNNVPEVIPMTKKIFEATKLSKGYYEYGITPDGRAASVSFWKNEEERNMGSRGAEFVTMDMVIYLNTPYNYERERELDRPYDIQIRRTHEVYELHYDFLKEVFKIFYGTNSGALEALDKVMLSHMNDTGKKIQYYTYDTGVRFNNRGIRLMYNGAGYSFPIWIYSNLPKYSFEK